MSPIVASPISSPRIDATNYLQKFQSSSYNGTILSPRTVENIQKKGILKNPLPQRVTWADQPKTAMPAPSQPLSSNIRNVNPAYMSMPIQNVNHTKQHSYSGAQSIAGIYKPAIIPSNK